MIDKQSFLNNLKNFMKNNLLIRCNDPKASRAPLIGHFGFFAFKTKFSSEANDSTAMYFLGYNQTIYKGIYPVIVYNLNSSENNFEICYGTSQPEKADYKWNVQYTTSKSLSSTQSFSNSYVKAVFTINTLQDFIDNVALIYQNIESIIAEYRTNFLCPNRVVNQAQVADTYKIASEKINMAERKDKRANSLKGIMKESFFHGASYMGSNFIS